MRNAALNFFPQAILKRDGLGSSPPKQGCPEFSPVVLVALATGRLLGEPAIALGWIGLGNNDASRHQQRRQGIVKRPQRNGASIPQGRSEHVPPADGCGLADLAAAQRPEEAARVLLAARLLQISSQ